MGLITVRKKHHFRAGSDMVPSLTNGIPWWPYLEKLVGYKGRFSAVVPELHDDVGYCRYAPAARFVEQVRAPMGSVPGKGIARLCAQCLGSHSSKWEWLRLHQRKYSAKSNFPNGKLTYGPRQYKVLLVIEAETIYLETAKALSRYADAGGQIIFIGKSPTKRLAITTMRSIRQTGGCAITALIKSKNVALFPHQKQ